VKNKPYRYSIYLLLKLSIAIVRCLPRKAALAFAHGMGTLAYFLVARQRNKVLENLRTAFSHEKTEKEIRQIALGVFRHFSVTLADLTFMKRITQANLEQAVDYGDLRETIRRVVEEGRGVIVMTGHLGNWELCGALLGIWGYDMSVVGKRIYYEKYNDLVVKARLEKGVSTIYQDESPKKILQHLKKGNLIGFVADQDVERLEGVFVDYFGKPSFTPIAPVRLAQISGSPIIMGALIREGDRYRLIYDREPTRVPKDASKEDVARYTQQWSKFLEGVIRSYPDQWAWMHDRWKTKEALSPQPSALSKKPKTGEMQDASGERQMGMAC